MYQISQKFKYISLSMVVSFGFNQEIPNEFLEYHLKKFYSDMGSNWEQNSTFGPIRFNHTDNDSFLVKSRMGLMIDSDRKSIYAFGHFLYQNNFKGYLYPRIVDNPDLFERYSGIPREIKRGWFNSGETDLSGILYENKWLLMQIGRGRQSWGAGNDIELALSEHSNSYDYGMLDLDFGKLKVRYFHGYLETDSLYYNRFLTGRGVEWNNQKNFLFSLSEIVIYSGLKRPLDIAYLNPMSTHLEIELNNRQNNIGTGTGNGVWQLSFDFLLKNKIKISANYLFDEFTLDNEQIDDGKGDGRAHSYKLLYLAPNIGQLVTKVYFSKISVGTNTFKHQLGHNNFVQRNKPLGWRIGSDSRESKIGMEGVYNNKIIINLDFGKREIGEKNFINNLYTGYSDYLDGPFPSGDINKIYFISSNLKYWIKPNFLVFSHLYYNNSSKSSKKIAEFKIGFDIYHGMHTLL